MNTEPGGENEIVENATAPCAAADPDRRPAGGWRADPRDVATRSWASDVVVSAMGVLREMLGVVKWILTIVAARAFIQLSPFVFVGLYLLVPEGLWRLAALAGVLVAGGVAGGVKDWYLHRSKEKT